MEEFDPLMVVLMDTCVDLSSAVGPIARIDFSKQHIFTPSADHLNMGGF